jgi:hypothetical protein
LPVVIKETETKSSPCKAVLGLMRWCSSGIVAYLLYGPLVEIDRSLSLPVIFANV